MGASIQATKVKDAKIVQGVLEGKSAMTIGKEVYPNQSPKVARVSVARRLAKATVQSNLDAALLKHGLTLESALKPIRDALKATKQEKRGEDWVSVPDMTTRLKASDRIMSLLDRARVTRAPVTAEQAQAIIEGSDEVELQRIVFRQE